MGFNYLDFVLEGGDALKEAFGKTVGGSSFAPTFQIGVVQEVLSDPGLFSIDVLNQYRENTLNPEYLDSAPRNSCIVRLPQDAADIVDPKFFLCFPFFPPHLSMPINPGENVWLVDPYPDDTGDLMYWVCRIPTPNYVDDINFTHADRTSYEIAGKSENKDFTKPIFPNGINIPEDYVLHPSNDYNNIFTSSLANKSVCFEPIPRFTKRPGDLVLQGSNNTMICLGTDRGFTSQERPKDTKTDHSGSAESLNLSNANYLPNDEASGKNKKPVGNWKAKLADRREPKLIGSIDIVAGRGQEKGTKPEIITNERNYDETVKNQLQFKDFKLERNAYSNPSEGDPDFVTDQSRVYISMKTAGDKNFGITWPNFGLAPAEDAGIKPYVISKSDEVRLVGRSSVRLYSEGGNASIQLLPASHISIQADRIVIGSGNETGHGGGDQVYIGDNASEPLVLGKFFREQILDPFLDACSNFATNHTIDSGPAFTNIGIGPGPVSIGAANKLVADLKAIKAKTNQILSQNAKTK